MTADEIRALRGQLDWSQQRLAQELGVSVQSIHRWERGRPISPLALAALMRLSQQLHPRGTAA